MIILLRRASSLSSQLVSHMRYRGKSARAPRSRKHTGSIPILGIRHQATLGKTRQFSDQFEGFARTNGYKKLETTGRTNSGLFVNSERRVAALSFSASGSTLATVEHCFADSCHEVQILHSRKLLIGATFTFHV